MEDGVGATAKKQETSPEARSWNRFKPVLICAGFVGGIGVLLWPFVSPGLRRYDDLNTQALGVNYRACPLLKFKKMFYHRHALPYIPATDKQLSDAMELTRLGLARLKPSNRQIRAVDLGSGDGRVVLAAVRSNPVLGFGFELNRWLVLYSKLVAWRTGLRTRATFKTADIWKVNLADFDVVYMFLGSEMMKEIERKLDREVTRNQMVVTNRFDLPRWKPRERMGLATLYLSSDQDHVVGVSKPDG
ncbi:hypothetical protein NDN08_003898 [Rhodosorus marinus]|uniref:Uncharacterized protein n=1 Tax=Rhodosorus marinus TaxID=101924 RepID=A0AAV8UKA9_9RHOD|nr:hypothetical protein NDN08_003898 [Rhodosorus marinus]